MRQRALLFYSKSCWCDFASQFDFVCVITSEPEAKSFKCLGNSVVNFGRARDKLLPFSGMTKLFLKLARTSRDRPKSAPYPRLKNSKKTSKCQVLYYSTRKSKFFEKKFSKKLHTQKMDRVARAKVSQCRKTERGDPLRFFNMHSVGKHEKIEEKQKFSFSGKDFTMPKKTERGDPLEFFNIHSVAKHQKKCRGPFGEKIFFEKKVSQCRKNERGESLVSPGMVCYAEKQEKPFWFSSLDRIVHFEQ